jgi:hypothetical protein
MTNNLSLTPISHNVKTGPIPVSTSSKSTCPDACPFKAGGCYAQGGPLNIHWNKITSGERGTDFEGFLAAVKKIRRGQLWRHNQAGDLAGDNNAIDAGALKALVEANRGRKGFTYTHKPMTEENAQAVKHANENGFTVNLSANNLSHADELKALNIGPVVVVVNSAQKENLTTPNGHKVVICPATVRDDVTCASCGLCQKQRGAIVGFPAHGNAKKKVDEKVA